MDQTINRSIQKKRTANFREDETRLLIQLWGSPSIQNKLLLTHRKAPVMRLLAANMQQRGFYRTPDEIKTRIRNLKCLYHRIKRSMATGIGIGTVDPDWPHYKAMDEIISKVYPRKITDGLLDDPVKTKVEGVEIKTEIDDVDMDDDDSWVTNESINSENDDDALPEAASSASPVMTIAKVESSPQQGSIQVKKTAPLQALPLQQVTMQPNAIANTPIQLQPVLKHNIPQLPTLQDGKMPVQNGGLPFPLLILNNVDHTQDSASTTLLKELIELQTQNLELVKQQLDIQKERLEFEREIGHEMVSMLGSVLQGLERSSTRDHTDVHHCIFDQNTNDIGTENKKG